MLTPFFYSNNHIGNIYNIYGVNMASVIGLFDLNHNYLILWSFKCLLLHKLMLVLAFTAVASVTSVSIFLSIVAGT